MVNILFLFLMMTLFIILSGKWLVNLFLFTGVSLKYYSVLTKFNSKQRELLYF